MKKHNIRIYYIHILLIILGTVLYFMANFQRVAVPGAIFDTLQEDFNLTAPFITAFGAVFMYVYALSLLAVGLLVDRFSGIKVLLVGAIVFSLGSLLFSYTSNLGLLYLARALLGFGAATFYLSLLQEAKKCFPDKYFGIVISVILFTGFLGGVCANAPFVIVANQFGWRTVFNVLTIIIVLITVAYAFTQQSITTIHENKKVRFCAKPFKEFFTIPNNCYLFSFIALNGGLYYTIQTVIGIKFLKDFMDYSTEFAALVLSIMIIIAAFSGITLASLSKIFNNKRVIFLRIVGIMSAFVFLIISLCIIFNIKTQIIMFLIILLAICGGLSPLTVPIIHATNKYENRSTAISIINCSFFFVVGLLGTAIGFLLDIFPPIATVNEHYVYGTNSYITVFALFFILSVFEVLVSFKIKDK